MTDSATERVLDLLRAHGVTDESALQRIANALDMLHRECEATDDGAFGRVRMARRAAWDAIIAAVRSEHEIPKAINDATVFHSR